MKIPHLIHCDNFIQASDLVDKLKKAGYKLYHSSPPPNLHYYYQETPNTVSKFGATENVTTYHVEWEHDEYHKQNCPISNCDKIS